MSPCHPVQHVGKRSTLCVNGRRCPCAPRCFIRLRTLRFRCSVRFEFDAIHNPSATQEEVFAAVRPLCESALDGYNITVLAYGQVPFPYCVGALWWY